MQLSTHSRVFIGKTKILYSLSNSQPSSPQSLTISTSQETSRSLTAQVFLMSGQRVSTCPVVTGYWAVHSVRPMLFPGYHRASELVHVVAHGRLSLLRLKNASLYVYTNLFIYSPAKNIWIALPLGYYETPAIKMGRQILLWYQALVYLGVSC